MNPFHAFQVARLPEIRFGSGAIDQLPDVLAAYGTQVLLVTGRRSLQDSPRWQRLLSGLQTGGLDWRHVTIDDEPSPDLVDEVVALQRGHPIDVVAGVGGGSVLDAAKAIAGLLRTGTSVLDH
ncbi:MAG: iron-containing alcohol dehydrogenase, partial [Sedimenticolaceae bacterium]